MKKKLSLPSTEYVCVFVRASLTWALLIQFQSTHKLWLLYSLFLCELSLILTLFVLSLLLLLNGWLHVRARLKFAVVWCALLLPHAFARMHTHIRIYLSLSHLYCVNIFRWNIEIMKHDVQYNKMVRYRKGDHCHEIMQKKKNETTKPTIDERQKAIRKKNNNNETSKNYRVPKLTVMCRPVMICLDWAWWYAHNSFAYSWIAYSFEMLRV